MKKPAANSKAGGGRSAVVGYVERVRIFARLQPPFKLVLHHLRRGTLKTRFSKLCSRDATEIIPNVDESVKKGFSYTLFDYFSNLYVHAGFRIPHSNKMGPEPESLS
jgi:hypothetical protein